MPNALALDTGFKQCPVCFLNGGAKGTFGGAKGPFQMQQHIGTHSSKSHKAFRESKFADVNSEVRHAKMPYV